METQIGYGKIIICYANLTGQDIRPIHSVIMEAIRNNGVFDEDYADIFKLTKTPKGSAVDWVLDFT